MPPSWRIAELLRGWFRRRRGEAEQPDPAEQAAVEQAFRARYQALRLLLAANSKALALMAELEHAAAGGRLFDMAFVRSRCTGLGVNVYQMTRQLNVLAEGRYQQLFDRLERIQNQLRAALGAPAEDEQAPLILPFDRIDLGAAELVGAKMGHLGEIRNRMGLDVPAGFVITRRAHELFFGHADLQPEIDRLLLSAAPEQADELYVLASRIQQLIVSAELPEPVGQAIEAAYAALSDELGGEPAVALRSSALDEDAAGASFAGQFRSLLNLRREHLFDAYREVIAGQYNAQAIEYRLQLGLRDDRSRMCVGCMVMVNARAGGVAYTGHPGDPADRNVHISAAVGLPKTVVDGQFPCDTIVVSRDEPHRVVEQTIVCKPAQFVCDPHDGVARREVPGKERLTPALSGAQAVELAAQALRLESHFGAPQDVEWALDGEGRLIILQSRALQQVRGAGPELVAGEIDPPLLRGGLCASPGAASGPVCWVRRESEALTFSDGDVLVLSVPLPRYAALLGRAAAIVAEHGGMAGHLATVARELSVPALFAVEQVGLLEQGATVTVDADGQAIHAGRVECLLQRQPAVPPSRAERPVQQALAQVMGLVTPLNLLDPDDVLSFRAEHCRTLHDITRFCHEQAVRETFAIGSATEFPRYASKQLHHNVRMQWWLIDLDDGFRGDVRGKYVKLDQIACAPFHALWEGMTAVRWDGPPAVDGAGFASVLFEATANPALGSPLAQQQPQGNYFMISSQFMNLQARLGMHFCGVEALAGPRPEENYLTFSFKGGAADESRRVGRVRLIADLLEEQGFVAVIHADTANARIGGLPADELLVRVKQVGYLLLHTRQLDMIMAESSTVERYRAKLRAEMNGLS